MRLVLELGYQKILFGKGAPIGTILEAMDGAKIVEKEYSSGSFTVKGDVAVSLELVPDDSVTLPDTEKSADYEKLRELATSRDKLRTEVAQLKKHIKEIEGVANGSKEESDG